METAKSVNLKNLTIKKLKEMLKKYRKLPVNGENEAIIGSIERAIAQKKRAVLQLTEDAKRDKLESLKSIFRVKKKIPEVFRGQTIGIPISEKGP